MDSETGVVTITNSGTMNTDKELTKGTKMISDLITNDEYNCKITRDYIENEGCKIRYYDSSSVIIMNTWDEIGGNWRYCVYNGKGGDTFQTHGDVAYILLGHELIHAIHHMNDTLSDMSKTVYRYIGSELVADIRENLSVSEEYNTVGLAHIVEYSNFQNGHTYRRFYLPMPGALTENALRTEQKLTLRTAY